jgi:hypothetical protein
VNTIRRTEESESLLTRHKYDLIKDIDRVPALYLRNLKSLAKRLNVSNNVPTIFANFKSNLKIEKIKSHIKFLQLCSQSRVFPKHISCILNSASRLKACFQIKRQFTSILLRILNDEISDLHTELRNTQSTPLPILDPKIMAALSNLQHKWTWKTKLSLWNTHRNKYNNIINNTPHDCTFNRTVKTKNIDAQINIRLGRTFKKDCGLDHFISFEDYCNTKKWTPPTSKDFENELKCTSEIATPLPPPDINSKKDIDHKLQLLADFINNLGPNFAIPSRNKKADLLFNSEILIERGFYALRWKTHLAHLPPNLAPRIPFYKKNCALPDNIDSPTEAAMLDLKTKILKNLSSEFDKCDPKIIKNWNFIRKFCKDNNLKIVSTDKSKKNLIFTLSYYNKLGDNFMHNSKDYVKLSHHRAIDISQRVNLFMKFLCEGRSCFTMKDYPKLTCTQSSPSKMFFLVKDHKDKDANGNYPLRPVASIHGTPVDKLDWIIQQSIQPLLSQVDAHLPNAIGTLERINKLNESNNFTDHSVKIFSLDVVSLFPSIPIDTGINAVMNLFLEHRHEYNPLNLDPEVLGKAIHFLFTNYEIQFNGSVYLQVKGAPMGARSSVALAIITMNHIEKIALMKVKDMTDIILYGRYVDDIIFICKNPKKQGQNKDDISTPSTPDIPKLILETFNNVHPNIQFTIENPPDNQWLPFLDFQLKLENNKILTKWYQKASHSGNIIHTTSHGPPDTKISCMTNFFKIIFDRCNNDPGLEEGVNTMISEMRHNGYSDTIIKRCIKKACNKHNDLDGTIPARYDKWTNAIPIKCTYLNNLAHFQNKKLITESQLPFVHVLEKNLKISSLGTKPTIPCPSNCKTCPLQEKPACLTSKCNYIASCKICGEEYIGKTDRRLQDRMKEHMVYVANIREEKSALAHHSINEHADILDDPFVDKFSFKLLRSNTDEPNNSIAESLYISKIDPEMNRKHEDLLKRRNYEQRVKDNDVYHLKYK